MTDMKDAKAQLRAAKKERPFYKKKRVWVLGVLGLLVIGAAVAPKEEETQTVAVASDTPDKTTATVAAPGESSPAPVVTEAKGPTIEGDAGEADDVTPGTCETSTFGTVTMKLTIRNDSSKRSDYIISGVVERDGVKLTDLNAYSQNVEAGQSAVEEMTGFLPTGEKGAGVTCRIVEVDRTAA